MNYIAGRARRRAGSSPTLGLALGGGGARGLAHVIVLEVLDELGVRPTIIAGTSIGALIGAAYGSGLSATDIHRQILAVFSNRAQVLARLMRARVGRFSDLILRRRGNPILIDAQLCAAEFLPEEVVGDFADLKIPLKIVATDFYARAEAVFETGDLKRAVAASIAIPGVFAPVEFDDRILVDGGAVNPLPYDLIQNQADLIVAVDVTYGGRFRPHHTPTFLEAVLGSAQIMQGSITAQKAKIRPPDILIRPSIEKYAVLDFMRAHQVLRDAARDKDLIKRTIADRIEAFQRR